MRCNPAQALSKLPNTFSGPIEVDELVSFVEILSGRGLAPLAFTSSQPPPFSTRTPLVKPIRPATAVIQFWVSTNASQDRKQYMTLNKECKILLNVQALLSTTCPTSTFVVRVAALTCLRTLPCCQTRITFLSCFQDDRLIPDIPQRFLDPRNFRQIQKVYILAHQEHQSASRVPLESTLPNWAPASPHGRGHRSFGRRLIRLLDPHQQP